MEIKHSLIFTSISNLLSNYCSMALEPNLIQIEPDDDIFLPHVIKKERKIKYNYRAEIMTLLHLCGSPTLALNYFFANCCYTYNDFDNAQYFILKSREQFYNEYQHISDKYPLHSDRIIYQMAFMVFHEVSHAIFDIYSELKDVYVEQSTHFLDALMDTYSSLMNDEVNASLNAQYAKICDTVKSINETKKQGISWANILDDYKTIREKVNGKRCFEEIACDTYSIHTLKLLSEYFKFPDGQILELYAAEQTAIQFLSLYSCWDMIYVRHDKKQYERKGIDLLRILSAHAMICYAFNDIESEISNFVLDEGINSLPILTQVDEIAYLSSIKERFDSIAKNCTTIDPKKKESTHLMLEYLNNEILSLLSLSSADKSIFCIAREGCIDVEPDGTIRMKTTI